MTRPLYIILHLPKTAGQTIREHLSRHLTPHSEYIHFGALGLREAKSMGLRHWRDRPLQERQRARVLHGHRVRHRDADDLPDRAIRFVGVLREPAARMVSHYNFHAEIHCRRLGRPVPEWNEWYAQTPRNSIARWIVERFLHEPVPNDDDALFQRVSELLDRFWLLGRLEEFDRFMSTLCEALEIPPLDGLRANASVPDSPRSQTLSQEISDLVRRDHPVDCALYQRYWDTAPSPPLIGGAMQMRD